MIETVTITHTAEGIRLQWPDCTHTVFGNSIYLAEAYAKAVRQQAACKTAIIDKAAPALNAIVDVVRSDGSEEEVLAKADTLREILTDTVTSCLD